MLDFGNGANVTYLITLAYYLYLFIAASEVGQE